MSNYLYQKFHGQYRILAPIDQATNDYPRNPAGMIETEDFYIPCRKNGKEIAQISHYGYNTLEVFITSIKTGRKLVKKCEEKGVKITDIKEGDGEITFRFKAKDIDFIASNLGAMTQGKNIRPFSIRNLPKSDYEIPQGQIDEYKTIVAGIPKGDTLIISRITDQFLDEKVAKSLLTTVERDLRLHKMSRQKKEYIHMKGLWDEYLEYLKEGLK